MVKYDFHITGYSRKKYHIDESLFSIEGKIIITTPYQARLLSDNINTIRKSEGEADQQVTPGQVNGLGLLHEIFHFMINYYEVNVNPGVFTRSIIYLKSKFKDDLDKILLEFVNEFPSMQVYKNEMTPGDYLNVFTGSINYLKSKFKDDLDKILLEFVNEFPSMQVYKNEMTPGDYLNGFTGSKSNKEIILEEIILLSIENINPATILLKELYDDSGLAKKTPYLNLLDETENFFLKEKPIGSDNLPLISFLKHPILSSPNSLDGQLSFILMAAQYLAD